MVDLLRVKCPGKKAHVVGHDWGGAVAWVLAGQHTEIVKSLTILNSPHPSVMVDLLRHDPEQQKRSQYMLYFDTELATKMTTPSSLCKSFEGDVWFDKTTEASYRAAWSEPRAVDSGLNWYR